MNVVLLRHASAGERSTWAGDDRLRPLDADGRRRADVLRDELREVGVTRVVSSPYLRCAETVAPLAAALGVEVELDERLTEGAGRAAALEALRDAVGGVACTHGDVLEDVLGRELPKGAYEVLGLY